MLAELFVGLLVGTAAGIFGVGGAFLAITLMHLFLEVPVHTAIGTALAMSVLTAASASYSYFKTNHIHFRTLVFIVLSGIPGSIIGAKLSVLFSARFLIFLLIGLLFLNSLLRFSKKSSYSWKLLVIAGFLVGLLSGLLGLGGGIMMVSLFLFLGLDSKDAVGTSLACIIFLGLAGSLVHMTQGQFDSSLFLLLTSGSIISSQLSSRWALGLKNKRHVLMQRIFQGSIALLLLFAEIF